MVKLERNKNKKYRAAGMISTGRGLSSTQRRRRRRRCHRRRRRRRWDRNS